MHETLIHKCDIVSLYVMIKLLFSWHIFVEKNIYYIDKYIAMIATG